MEKIIGTTLGSCVHVAGMMNFFNLAEEEGYETKFLGISMDLDQFIKNIYKEKPQKVALSYRLTPEPLNKILKELKEKIDNDEYLQSLEWIFGGTEPASNVAEKYNIFDKIFYSTEDIDDTMGCFII